MISQPFWPGSGTAVLYTCLKAFGAEFACTVVASQAVPPASTSTIVQSVGRASAASKFSTQGKVVIASEVSRVVKRKIWL